MRITAAWLVVAAPLTAAAQPGNTPYYAAPPPAPVVVAPEPKAAFEVGLVYASPRGDWEQIEAEASPGFNMQLGINVSRGVMLFGGLRYVRVELDAEALGGGAEGLELSHRELRLGLRLTTPVSPGASFFIEGDVHSARLEASFEGESDSVSGAGLGVRGGLIFRADRNIGIGVSLGYSSSEIEGDEGSEEFENAWLTGDAFVSFLF